MAMGRPREWNREQIALDLLTWAKKDDSINLNGFCCEHELPPSKLSDWAREDKNFRETYESAKAFIGKRRELMLTDNRLHVKAYDLNASTYDFFLKEEKRHQLEFESGLRKDETKEAVNADLLAQYNAMMGMLKALQEVRSIEDSNSSDEAKS